MGPSSMASTLELGLLTGVALLSWALLGAIVAARRPASPASPSGSSRRWLPPLPILLVPCGYVGLLLAAPSVRLAAMAVVAVGWAAVRAKRGVGRGQDASTAAPRPRLSTAVRLAALAWLGTAPGLMVAADRAPPLFVWSDALGALLLVAAVTTLVLPSTAARIAAYFRQSFATPGQQQRVGERLLAWSLYVLALSTPEGWLTLFAPAVLASKRLDASGETDETEALGASAPMS